MIAARNKKKPTLIRCETSESSFIACQQKRTAQCQLQFTDPVTITAQKTSEEEAFCVIETKSESFFVRSLKVSVQ